MSSSTSRAQQKEKMFVCAAGIGAQAAVPVGLQRKRFGTCRLSSAGSRGAFCSVRVPDQEGNLRSASCCGSCSCAVSSGCCPRTTPSLSRGERLLRVLRTSQTRFVVVLSALNAVSANRAETDFRDGFYQVFLPRMAPLHS